MRLSDIDLRLLRVFKAVADSGGFVKAQGELGISQPAISSHIANLEQRLGLRLCNRGPKGFSLTPQGQEVLDETNRLLSHLNAYADKLTNIGKKEVQQLCIGVVDCLVTDPNNPLPQAIRSARAELEDLHFRIGVYDYLDCLTEIRAGRLDIGVVGIELAGHVPDDIETRHIYDEESGLFCSTDHPCCGVDDPEALAALLKQSQISALSFLANPIDEGFDIHLLDGSAEVSQGNIESTAYLTLAGTHVGLIPLHFADQWVRSGDMVRVAPDVYSVVSQIHLVRVKSVTLSDEAHRFWGMFDTMA